MGERDELTADDMRHQIGPGEFKDPLQRSNRITLRAEIQRDQIGLAVGQHGDGRRVVAEMATLVQFGQRRLDRAVAAVDDQHLGLDPGNGAQRLADLIDMLHFIMEDVAMLGAKAPHPRKQRSVSGRPRV
jgi:hypothetical protein